MATGALTLIVSVVDQASQKLKTVGNQTEKFGKQAKAAGVDLVGFNKTLFSTTAFIGTLAGAFYGFGKALDHGADLERLQNQYERVLGKKGTLFDSITNLTTTGIDRIDAMRSALRLGSLGIVQDSDQAAEFIARAGTAAKMAGVDSSEGIKQMTQALVTGNLQGAEFLNLIARTNPALQAQLAVLGQAGGTLGKVITTQAKLNLMQNLLRTATEGHMQAERDLADVLKTSRGVWRETTGTIGIFLGKAVAPLIDKISLITLKVGSFFEEIRESKHIVFLARGFLTLTAGATALIGALGTMRLIVKSLAFVGVGFPGLRLAAMLLVDTFFGVTKSVDGVVAKFELFGKFVKGVTELISNLDSESGLSKMNEEIRDALQEAGILEIAKQFARFGSIVYTVFKDVSSVISVTVNKGVELFSWFNDKVLGVFGSFKTDWTTWWTSDSISTLGKFGRAALAIVAPLLALFGLKKIGGFLGGVLSKIPVIGKLFGGGSDGDRPKGTQSDPIYTKSTDGALGGLGDIFSTGAGGAMITGILGKVIGMIPSIGAMVGGAAAMGVGVAAGSAMAGILEETSWGKPIMDFIGKPGEWLANLTTPETIMARSELNAAKPIVPAKDMSSFDIMDNVMENLRTLDSAKKQEQVDAMEEALRTAGKEGINQDFNARFGSKLVSTMEDSNSILRSIDNKAGKTSSSLRK